MRNDRSVKPNMIFLLSEGGIWKEAAGRRQLGRHLICDYRVSSGIWHGLRSSGGTLGGARGPSGRPRSLGGLWEALGRALEALAALGSPGFPERSLGDLWAVSVSRVSWEV